MAPPLTSAAHLVQGVDHLGVPTKIAWKPFYSNLPPPALKGPGGFASSELPTLCRNRSSGLAAVDSGPVEVRAPALHATCMPHT